MKHIKYIILYFISIFLRPFFKIDNNLLVFSARGGMGFEGQSKYLFLYANKNTNYNCIWIAKSLEVITEVKGNGFNAIYYFSWEAISLALQAKAVFITHSLSDVMPVFYKRKTIVIDLWHGIPLKRISFLDKNLGFRSRILDSIKSKRIDYLISSSFFFESIYAKSFKLRPLKIKSYGMVSIEFLRNPELFYSAIKNPFPLCKNIILYAPTFRDYNFTNSLFETSYLNWLEDELIKTNSLFYIKLHPSEIAPNIKGYNNIKIINSTEDIYILCLYTNHLISDYSSVFLDFMAAFPSRKVTLYIPDFNTYRNTRNFNFDYQEKFGDLVCKDEYSLLNKKLVNSNLVDFINPKQNSCEKIIKLL